MRRRSCGLISSILLEKSTDVSSKTDSAISAWAVMPAFRLIVGSDALYTSAMLRRMFSTLRSICCLARHLRQMAVAGGERQIFDPLKVIGEDKRDEGQQRQQGH